MKKNGIVIVASVFLLAACGDNTTDTTYSEKTSDTVAPTSTDASSTASSSTYTNVTPEYMPPDNVKTAFQTKYPQATDVNWSAYKPYERIDWEWTGWPSMDSSYHAVNYKVENRNFWSWFDKDHNWIGSSSVVEDSTMLPDPVKKAVKKSYAGYNIKSIDEESDKNRTVYEIKLEKGDATAKILVDKNGKILKKKDKA